MKSVVHAECSVQNKACSYVMDAWRKEMNQAQYKCKHKG